MKKEHVLAWLTCHVKLPHCLGYGLFFTVTHEYNFCFLQIQHAREMTVCHVLLHMQGLLKNDNLVNSQICYIVWELGFSPQGILNCTV